MYGDMKVRLIALSHFVTLSPILPHHPVLPYVRLRLQAHVDEFYKPAFPLSFSHLLQQLQNVRMPNGWNSNVRVSYGWLSCGSQNVMA